MSIAPRVGKRVGARGSSWLTPLPAVVALPGLFLAVGCWELWRGTATLDLPGADGLVARLRLAAAGLAVCGGAVSLLAGLGALGLTAHAARRGARSRPALVAGFTRLGRWLPAALAVEIAGLPLGLLGTACFEAGGLWFTPDADDRTALLALMGLLYAAVAVWGGVAALRNLRGALRLFALAPLRLLAVPVTQAEAPGLFALLRDVAASSGAPVPTLVLAGVVDSFFVTAFPVAAGSGPVREGQTLHVPMPALAVLSPVELRTILAHELAHFSGEDTEYTRQFQPLYAGLRHGAAVLSRRRTDWGSTWPDRALEQAVHPQTAVAVHVLTRFDLVVQHWSRVRELDADRMAVRAGSAAALGSSLLRMGLVDDALRAILHGIAAAPDTAPADLAIPLAAALRAPSDPARLRDTPLPHPADSHPPDRQRLAAVGVPVDAAEAAALRPASAEDRAAAHALFADWDATAQRLASLFQAYVAAGMDAWRAEAQAAAGAVSVGEVVLVPALRRLVITTVVFGGVCLLMAGGCTWAAFFGVAEDRYAWPILVWDAFAIVGLSFVAWGAVRLWRGRGKPFLVLGPDGFTSRGLVGPVPWLAVATVSVSAWGAPTIGIRLHPGASLPARTGAMRRAQVNGKLREIQFNNTLPRNMDARTLRALLVRHVEAARARAALAAQEGAAPPTSRKPAVEAPG